MKLTALFLIIIAASLMASGTIHSYADPQLDALLRIATQARDNLKLDLSKIDTIPDEIMRLFKGGSDETDALSKAIDKQDISSARQHFLAAMKYFKTAHDKISSLNTASDNSSQVTGMNMQSEITRLQKMGETLRTVSITNHINFDFAPFDQLLTKAKQSLDNGKFSDASKSISDANQFILNAHHMLTDAAVQRTNNRALDFTEKQIERIDRTSNNVTQSAVQQNIPIDNSTMENPKDMAIKLKKLVSEGKVSEALKVIKSKEFIKRRN